MDRLQEFYLDELHDQMLYEALSGFARGDASRRLKELAGVERGHSRFFSSVMKRLGIEVPGPPSSLRIRLEALLFVVFGFGLMMKIFEARESATVSKYLELYGDKRLVPEELEALKGVIRDEMEHERFFGREAQLALATNIRDILLGMNDGLVELLAAVSGLAGAFAAGYLVGLSGIVIGVSGSISMAVGAYVSTKAEAELRASREARARLSTIVFGAQEAGETASEEASESAKYVGVSYLVGALVPTLPYFLPVRIFFDQIVSVAVTLIAILITGYLSSAISGVDWRRKVVEMMVLAIAAAVATYALGTAIRAVTGLKAPAV